MFSLQEVIRYLVAPALGCTEVVAISLCSSYAASLINREKIDLIEGFVSFDVFKNAFGVIIPKTKGLKGPEMALALGAVGGNPDFKMEVLNPIDSSHIKRAKELIRAKKVKLSVEDRRGIYVRVKIRSENNISEALIKDYQDRLTCLKLNGVEKHVEKDPYKKNVKPFLLKWIKGKSLKEMISLVENVDDQDFYLFIKEGVMRNLELAEYGLNHKSGMGVGFSLKSLSQEDYFASDVILKAKVLTAAATDARMSGAEIPATSSAGSGNNGLVATIPLWVIGKDLGVDEEKLIKGVVLSHLITAKVKSYMGQLSYMCSCSIAAGAGLSASLSYIMDGSIDQIAYSILNIIEDLAGVICDGAKPSCSLKLATAVQSAYQSALFSLNNTVVSKGEGITGDDLEGTLKNLESLNKKSSDIVDKAIVSVLLKKLRGKDYGAL